MGKSRYLAIFMFGAACLLLIGCKTTGTPKHSDGAPTKSRAAAGPQASSPAGSASPKRTASFSKSTGPVASPQPRLDKREAAPRAGKPSRPAMAKPIGTLRIVLYSTLAFILLVVIGAITAERSGRHRKLTPLPVNARR
jgi:hypothetical protein